MTGEEMVEEFLCSGCVCGSDTKCGHFDNDGQPPATVCRGHVLGTIVMPIGNIALGMPKGFNRPGFCHTDKRTHNQMPIRLWTKGTKPEWDTFNVPVWALEKDGFLFVRTAMPRVGGWFVDVIEGAKFDEIFAAGDVTPINVTSKYDDYD